MRSRSPHRPACRRALTVVATIVALSALAAPRYTCAADDGNASRDAVRFARFLDDHPWVARDLQRDPTLANDARYLEEHRSLREFVANNSDVRRALRADPYAVLRHAHRIERAAREHREIGREEMARFDRFLRDHPEVVHDLHGDPSLVNDRAYLGDHPSFRDFLHEHPAIRQELQDNPYTFMRRWDRYAHREGAAPARR
jgi:hypothetical protein